LRGLPPRLSIPAAVFQVVDMLENGQAGEPRAIFLTGAPAVLRRTLGLVARESRLRGYVPLAADVVGARSGSLDSDAVLEAVEHRHVLLLDWHDRRSSTAGAGGRGVVPRLICRLGARSSRPHLILSVHPRAAGLAIRRLDEPGPSVRLPDRLSGLLSPVVRETPVPYEVRPDLGGHLPGGGVSEQVSRAVREAKRGRHAEAERRLREAGGQLARRDNHAGAGTTAWLLGHLLLDRGRASEAQRHFEAARARFDLGGAAEGVVMAVTGLGLALTDDARLTEAESALRSAVLAAPTLDASPPARAARLALSRCLYWMERPEDAARELAPVLPPAGDEGEESVAGHPCCLPWVEGWPDIELLALCHEARLALALRDTVRAAAAARRAGDRAHVLGGPWRACAAHRAQAAVHAATGDVARLREHVGLGLEAARAAHAPLGALRLRLVLLDGLQVAGHGLEMARAARALARVRLDRLPGLLRRRLDGVLRHGPRPRPAPGIQPEWFDDLTAVLALCRDTEDDQALLERLASDLKRRLRASVVVVKGVEGTMRHDLAVAGAAGRLALIEGQSTESGVPVGPLRTEFGVEMAVSLRHAGAPVGVLACRWPVDREVDGTRASMLLGAAATALAPAIRSRLDQQAHPSPVLASEDDLIGASEAIEALRRAIGRAARAPFPVLIEGESGSGKEVVARAIHRGGPRRHRRFCAFNCAALTDDLLEAELFGYARGAFTGAIAERVGLFEDADGGTVFLDEVADLSPRAQAKLLRVIQEGEIRRVGENVTRPIDVRILAASNRPLATEVAAGRFRQDLAYRLDVIRLVVPPLRERIEDIPTLALHFWAAAAIRVGSRATLAPGTLAALTRYRWPGNVRELQNVMAVLAVTTPRRGSVAPAALPDAIRADGRGAGEPTLEAARRAVERRLARAALAQSGGRRAQAAAALGLTRQGFAKLLTRLQLAEVGDLDRVPAMPICAVAESPPPPWPAPVNARPRGAARRGSCGSLTGRSASHDTPRTRSQDEPLQGVMTKGAG